MQERGRALADHFDGWYAAMAVSPLKDRIMQRHLGLPPELLSTSLLPWEGIAHVTGLSCRVGVSAPRFAAESA